MQDYDKAIELDPQNTTMYCTRWQFREVDLEDYEWAMNDYTKAIEIDPKDDTAYFMRWNLYEKLWKTEEADKDFQIANTLNLSRLE